MKGKPVSVLRAIILGGLTVGALDLADAFIFFGLRGATLIRIPQGIAAGLIGRPAAISGGAATAALGVGLHFTIATIIVAIFVLVSRALPVLAKRPFLFGPLYGVVAYVVMTFVVVRLSAIHASGFPATPPLINGLLIHMFGVGLPSALFARAAARS